MNKLKIEMSVDVTDTKQVAALNTFVKSIGAAKAALNTFVKSVDAAKVAVIPSKEAVKKAPAKVVEETTEKTVEETTEKTVEETTEKTVEETTTSIEDVRDLLATKIGEHRAVIRKKLDELEAKNVSALKKEDLPIFAEFLTTLA